LSVLTGIYKRAIDIYVCSKSSMPLADTAVKIAKALGVTVKCLITGEDSSTPNEANRITRSILTLNKRDQKLVALLVKSMKETQK
jgi:transcriptional regulator with XRE-family HTH domain